MNLEDGPGGLIDYPNVPPIIGAVISGGKASLRDLDEWMGLEDVYDLLEIMAVDAHNQRIMHENRGAS